MYLKTYWQLKKIYICVENVIIKQLFIYQKCSTSFPKQACVSLHIFKFQPALPATLFGLVLFCHLGWQEFSVSKSSLEHTNHISKRDETAEFLWQKLNYTASNAK